MTTPDAHDLEVLAEIRRQSVALEGIAQLIAAALELEPDPDERTGEPEPDPPIDEWQPVKGGRAWFIRPDGDGLAVIVDRIFESEGDTWAHVVDEDGDQGTVPLAKLEPPR